MESIETDVKFQSDAVATKTTEPVSTKLKKKKKKLKKPKEKKCTGLKELLEQINQERLEKIKLGNNVSETKSGEILPQNEDKNKENTIKESINIFNSFISGTTAATSSHDDLNEIQKYNFDKYFEKSYKLEYSDLKPNYLIKNSDFSEDDNKNDEENQTNERKVSSPIMDYYDGFDKILSETHKGSVDMANSMNFIKKKDFISNNSFTNVNNNNNFIESNIFNKSEEVNHYNDDNTIIDIKNNNDKGIIKDNIISINQYNINNNNYINNENVIGNNNIDLNNKINSYYEDSNYFNNYFNISYCQAMDYYNDSLQNNNRRSKFNLDVNKNNNRKFKKEKNKSKFNQTNFRKGDWLCNFCLNLNFSFRTVCNRCKEPKP